MCGSVRCLTQNPATVLHAAIAALQPLPPIIHASLSLVSNGLPLQGVCAAVIPGQSRGRRQRSFFRLCVTNRFGYLAFDKYDD